MKKFFNSIATSGSRLFVALLQLTLAASIAAAQSPQAFTPTGNLNTGRNAQRAIPLNDGTVLVTGGYDANGNGLASTELYHPATGVFTTSGSLNTACRNCAITLLDDGTVLVTGGYDISFNSLARAEDSSVGWAHRPTLERARPHQERSLLRCSAPSLAPHQARTPARASSAEVILALSQPAADCSSVAALPRARRRRKIRRRPAVVASSATRR